MAADAEGLQVEMQAFAVHRMIGCGEINEGYIGWEVLSMQVVVYYS
jgi:hypothetical protein